MLHDLLSTLARAVELDLVCLTGRERGRMAGQSQSLVEVWQVVKDHKHGIA